MLSHLAGRLASLVPGVGEGWGEWCPDTDISDAEDDTAAADVLHTTNVSAGLAVGLATGLITALVPGLAASLSTTVTAGLAAVFPRRVGTWARHPAAELPAELWGEIARFSSREDIMNLRRTSAALRYEADAAIATMTLSGSDALRAFTRAGCFSHLTTLRLIDIDDASLYDFAAHLTVHPRQHLTIEIDNKRYQSLPRGLDSLCTASLAKLSLHNVFLIDSVVAALDKCRFPLALHGYFGANEFLAATRFPTLTTLTSPSTEFDDALARLVASHQTLQTLEIQANEALTSRGIAELAHIPTLQALTINQRFTSARPIDAVAASALAANRTLERLSIVSSIQALSGETFSNLSESRTLKTLEISVCDGMHCLTNMVSLESLTLFGSRFGPDISAALARVVAGLPNLHTLRLSGAGFATGALCDLLAGCRVVNIHLHRIVLHQEAVDALIANPFVKTLTLKDVYGSVALLSPLFEISTLESLTVDGQ